MKKMYNVVMDHKIYELCKKLNSALYSSDVYLSLVECEKELENNEEVMRLSYQKDVACTLYSDSLKIHDENDEEVKELLKKLNAAKFELDSHPLVKKYLQNYSEFKQILYQINTILFKDYTGKECM